MIKRTINIILIILLLLILFTVVFKENIMGNLRVQDYILEFLNILWLIIPCIIFILIWITFFKNMKINCLFYVLSFAIPYILLLSVVCAYNLYLDYKIVQLGLDGMFEWEELTPEQKRYFTSWVNDTGRNLAPFILLIYASIVTLCFFFIITVYNFIKKY